MPDYRVISSDNHIYEPRDLWTSRIAPKYRDQCPQIRPVEGGEAWFIGDVRGQGLTQGTQPGKRFEDPDALLTVDTFENVLPGGYIPEEAVKDMDIDGVDMGIVYPTVGLPLFYCVRDSDLFSAVCGAYNDFVAEFCSASPRKLKGIAMLNVDDVGVAVEELQRCAKLGFVGAMIPIFTERKRYDSPDYEPLWASAQDLEMPISLHINTNRPTTDGEYGINVVELQKPVSQVNVDHWARMSIGDMIFSGVFERYPKLIVGAVELDLAWVPHFLQKMDFTYSYFPTFRKQFKFKDGMLPSDIFHRNVFVSFQEDVAGVRLRDIIGVDNLMWGADYPHNEGTWPRSLQIIEENLADCTEEEKAKIAGGNAARVYRLE